MFGCRNGHKRILGRFVEDIVKGIGVQLKDICLKLNVVVTNTMFVYESFL